jgi:hypothetical protein
VKCTACANQAFVPVSDQMVAQHLRGRGSDGSAFVAGVYPVAADDTCWFLAADFDEADWRRDVKAFAESCRSWKVPVSIERSRSGNGAQAWIFFEEAVSAALARRLGSALITETLDRVPDIGFASYDRLFPSQDSVPGGGFGNLIALPLQGLARRAGNSLFLNEALEPYEDQWGYLAGVRRVGTAALADLVGAASAAGRILAVRIPVDDDDEEPWLAPPSRRRGLPTIAGPFPSRLTVVTADQLYVPRAELPAGLVARLMRLAAFQNPECYAAQAMRLATNDKPRIISCAELTANHIGLPRGCQDVALDLVASVGVAVDIDDRRFAGAPVDVSFIGQLRPGQTEAVAALAPRDTGVLAATTAFLDLAPGMIGTIGGGKRKPSGVIDVALIQSLVRKGEVDDIVGDYGHLIVDECHHLSAVSFELVARRAKTRFVLGLSATVTRKDGHHPIIFMQCGPIRKRVDARAEAARRPFDHLVRIRPTAFRLEGSADRPPIQDVYRALAADEARNEMIFNDVLAALEARRSPVVITERTDHLEALAQRLSRFARNIVVLRGGQSERKRRDAMARLAAIPDGDERVILATGRYLGEGFDDQRLDTLFLTMPGRLEGYSRPICRTPAPGA